MITAVEGRPGMGKSVYLVSLIHKYLKNGYAVYTNINIPAYDNGVVPRYHYFESFDDLVGVRLVDLLDSDSTCKGIKIVLDEMQVYLSSRNWDKLDQKFQLLLQQHRKRGIDIVGATQSIKRADVVFRELVQVFYRIRKIVSFRLFGYGFGWFYLREFDPDNIESGTRDYGKGSWPINFIADPILMASYDTTQEYKLTEPEGQLEIRQYRYVKKEVVEPVLISKDLQIHEH